MLTYRIIMSRKEVVKRKRDYFCFIKNYLDTLAKGQKPAFS